MLTIRAKRSAWKMKVVLDYLAEYGEMGEKDLQKLPNMRPRPSPVTRQTMERGLIESGGRGASERYRLV